MQTDGVLNHANTRTTTSDGWCFVEDNLVKKIKKIIDLTDAKIVLSSTWRICWHQEDESLNEPSYIELKNKFQEYGMEFYDKLGPMRPRRSIALNEWFKANRHLSIDSFAIIDDWTDFDFYSKHLILTDPRIGITDKNVEEAIAMLNNQYNMYEVH